MGMLTHLFLSLGIDSPGRCHCSLHPTQAGHLLAIYHPVSRTDWRNLVYIFAEMVPDFGLLNQSFKGISRRKRIAELRADDSRQSICWKSGRAGRALHGGRKLQLARTTFYKAIDARATSLDCFYRRGVCAILLGDASGALPDLERWLRKSRITTSIAGPRCWRRHTR